MRLCVIISVRRGYLTLLPGSSLKSRHHGTPKNIDSRFRKRKRIAAIQDTHDKTIENITLHYDVNDRTQTTEEYLPLTGGLMKGVMENKQHDIKNFLARPIMIGSGVVDSTMTPMTFIQTVNLPDDYVSHSTVKEKLRGFRYFRGTARITMVINGTRFQQGRLLNTFFPQVQQAGQRYAAAIDSLTTLTQLPRVELDVSTDDQVTMDIPWVNSYMAYDLNTQVGKQGVFQTWVYGQLYSPTGDANFEYTIYVSYHDVVLSIPSAPAGFVAQAMFEKQRRLKKDPISEEMESDRPVSTSLHYLSRLSGMAAKIPLLSTIASPTSWFLGKAQETAYSWGFSKPTDIARQTNFITRPLLTAVNATGNDMSSVLSVFQENTIMHKKGIFGTDIDEMSISSIVSRFCYMGLFGFNDTQPVGSLIATIGLAPGFLVIPGGNRTINSVAIPTYLPSPAFYVGTMFKYWRGGFKFKFKFVKTEFHSGRLLFCFSPDPNFTYTNLNATNYMYREVVDIRNTTEYTFSVPYVSNQGYQQFFESIGNIYIVVLNQLRAPATVSQFFSIIYEGAMTEDTEFQVPLQRASYYPVVQTDAPVGSQSNNPGWVPQGIDDKPDQTEMVEETVNTQPHEELKPIASSTTNDGSALDVAPYCIGESVVSLRQMIKRHANFLRLTTQTVPANGYLVINPRVWAFPYISSSAYPTPTGVFGNTSIPDNMAIIAALFMYNKGGMRLKMYPVAPPSTSNTGAQLDTIRIKKVDLAQNQNLFSVYNYPGTTNLQPQDSVAIFPQAINPSVEVALPFYHKLPLAINQTLSYYQGGQASATVPDTPDTGFAIQCSTNTNLSSYIVSRCAADDFSFGFFLGTVRLALYVPYNYGTTPATAPW